MNNQVPDIKKCPRCGNHIFLGETECSNCGYSVATVEDRLRSLSPTPVATIMMIIGIFIAVLGFSMDNNLVKFIMVVLGGGGVIGGGLAYAWLTIFNDPMRKRK